MRKNVSIKQRDYTDCGAACLASVAAHYKLMLPVARVRQLASTDNRGTNVLGLIEAAEKLGFRAKGVKGPFESLFKIPVPSIAHVIVKGTLHHYVVIYSVRPKFIEVMNPADGKFCRHSHEEFKQIWSGVMILLLPLEPLEQGNNHQSTISRFLTLLAPHRSVMFQSLFGAAIYTLIGLTTSIYIQKIVDYVLVNGNSNLLNLMSVVMIILLLMGIFIGFMKSLLTLQTGQMIDARLILGYYKHLLKLPQHFFDTMRVGEILSRINDAVKIRAFINDVAISIIVNAFIILFSFALMFTYYWKLAVVVLLILPLYILIYWITNRLNKKVERRLMEKSAELESQLVESMTSVLTIKSFGIERHANAKTEDKFYSLLQTVYTSGLNSLFSNFSTEMISKLFTIILLWTGASYALNNSITPGELLSFYALMGYFTGPASSLVGMNKIFQNALIAADRLFEIMDLEREKDTPGRIALTRDLIGNIEFRNIHFRYSTRATVFKDFNLTISKGTVVALVGESGSGKSSLARILHNLYPINDGSIHIGAYDLKYIDNKSLRELVAIVPQKIDLFAGNVLENIALGDDQPDMKTIISLCQQLGLTDFIGKLPAGFHTYLGENGATLSGGQKQRIAIARALYRNPEILILDEATASLDSLAEQYVQKAVESLRAQHKTVILIAHRLSTVLRADKIVVLDNGKVAEEGTHRELLENRKEYYTLWKNQFPVPEVINHV
jgi:ABC-type bacteriocin transporter